MSRKEEFEEKLNDFTSLVYTLGRIQKEIEYLRQEGCSDEVDKQKEMCKKLSNKCVDLKIELLKLIGLFE